MYYRKCTSSGPWVWGGGGGAAVSRPHYESGYGFSRCSIIKPSATRTTVNLIVTIPIHIAGSRAPVPCHERLWGPPFCVDNQGEGKSCCPDQVLSRANMSWELGGNHSTL